MLTRRDFLKMVGAGAAALFLGCSSKNISKEEPQKSEPVPNSPYCGRYEEGFPKFKEHIKEYQFGLPDFPAYRLKYGNWALNKDGAVIPPKEIEQKDDAVWYSYNKDAVNKIGAFVWEGIVLDLTDAVNENPYLHPWHPEHEKHYNAIRSILFPRDERDLENMVVRKVSWTYKQDERNPYRYWLNTEYGGTPIRGRVWLEGIGDYEVVLPLSIVVVDDLENEVYRKIKEGVDKFGARNEKDRLAFIGGVTCLHLYDRDGDGVIDGASAGQLRIPKPKISIVDDRIVSPRPAGKMYMDVVEEIRKAFNC